MSRRNSNADEELVGTVRLPLGSLFEHLQQPGKPVFDQWLEMSLNFDSKKPPAEKGSDHALNIRVKISLEGKAGERNGSGTATRDVQYAELRSTFTKVETLYLEYTGDLRGQSGNDVLQVCDGECVRADPARA